LTESTPKLTSLAYRNMSQTCERAFWLLFKAIAGQIKALDLRGCARLRGTFFKLFGPELEEVLLDGCVLLEDALIEDISTRCNCLRTLKLDGCRKLTDESLRFKLFKTKIILNSSLISRHFRELRTLTLCGDFPRFSADGLSQIARISNLQSLRLL
jgi:hypothetical protein